MKRFLLAALLLLSASVGFAQDGIYPTTMRVAGRLRYGPVVPSSCDKTKGEVFSKTVAPDLGPYYCNNSGQFEYLVGSGEPGSIADGQVAFGVGTAIGGSDGLTFKTAAGQNSFQFGAGNNTLGTSAYSFAGGDSNAISDGIAESFVFGTGNSCTSSSCILFGTGNEDSTNGNGDLFAAGIDNSFTDSAKRSFILGRQNTTDSDRTFLIGNALTAAHARTVLIGDQITTTTEDAVYIGMSGTAELVVSSGLVELNAANLKMYGSTSGAITHAVPAVITSYTVTDPSAQGAANTTYKNDGSGNLSFAAAAFLTSSRITNGTKTTDDVIIDSATKGLVLKDAAGTPHYWRLKVSTLGVLTTEDAGTTSP